MAHDTNKEKHDFAELFDRTIEMRDKIREYEIRPEIHGTADALDLLHQDRDKTQVFYNRLEKHIEELEKLQENYPDYPEISAKLDQFRQNLSVAQDDLDFIAKKTEKIQEIVATQNSMAVEKADEPTKEQPSTVEREETARQEKPAVSSIASYIQSWFTSNPDESAKENIQPLITPHEAIGQSIMTKEERDLLGEESSGPSAEQGAIPEPVRNAVVSYFQGWFTSNPDESAKENIQSLITPHEAIGQSILTKEERDLLGEESSRPSAEQGAIPEPVRNAVVGYFQSWFTTNTDKPTPEETSEESSNSTSAMFAAFSPDGNIPPANHDDCDEPSVNATPEDADEAAEPNAPEEAKEAEAAEAEAEAEAEEEEEEEEEEDTSSRINSWIGH